MSDEQVAIERKRGDFFRDTLVHEYGCPPRVFPLPCRDHTPCPYGIETDDEAAWKTCWDEVEARQR